MLLQIHNWKELNNSELRHAYNARFIQGNFKSYWSMVISRNL